MSNVNKNESKLENEVAEKEATDISTDVLHFSDMAGAGAEEITADDIKMPYLQVVESGSDYVKPGTSKYNKSINVGDIINTATGEAYDGETGINIIPITSKKAFTEWRPNRGGFVGHRPSLEGSIEVEYTSENGAPRKKIVLGENDLVETMYFLVIAVLPDGDYFPAMLSMSSSRLSAARELNTAIYNITSKKMPAFAAMLNISSTTKSKDTYTWCTYKIARLVEHSLLKSKYLDINNVENPLAREIYLHASELYKQIIDKEGGFLSFMVAEAGSEDTSPTGGSSEGSSNKSGADKLDTIL